MVRSIEQREQQFRRYLIYFSENTPFSFALLTSLGVLRAATLLPVNTDYLEYNMDSILNEGQVCRILDLIFITSNNVS